jgi:hypothetical protein
MTVTVRKNEARIHSSNFTQPLTLELEIQVRLQVATHHCSLPTLPSAAAAVRNDDEGMTSFNVTTHGTHKLRKNGSQSNWAAKRVFDLPVIDN